MSLNRIELLGCSGIGKTTLLQTVLRQRTARETWLSEPEALLQAAREQPGAWVRTPLRTLMILALKHDLLKARRQSLASRILASRQADVPAGRRDEYEVLIGLHSEALRKADDLSVHQQRRVVDFYRSRIKRYGWLEAHGLKALFVDDEGIVKNNSAMGSPDAFKALADTCPGLLARLAPRGIICCTMSPEACCERRLQRAAQGRGTFVDQSQGEERLLRLCRWQVLNTLRKTELWAGRGVAVLQVDMTRPVVENAGTVLHFIRETQAGCQPSARHEQPQGSPVRAGPGDGRPHDAANHGNILRGNG